MLPVAGDRCTAGFQSPLCPLWVIRVGLKQAAASPDVRFTSNSGQRQASCCVRFVPKGDLLGVKHVSITITPSIRRLDRHLADKPLSTGRLSEYPTDYFVGICIETSAMAEQDTLWLPRVDFPNYRLRLLPLDE